MKATFGFGENVPWNPIGSDAKERSHAHAQPQSPSTHSRWVTRCNVKVDRIACPWLIRRFVDNAAEFIFVSEDTLLTTAHRLKAIRFDAPEPRHCKAQPSREAVHLRSDPRRLCAR
jgi:hypothetical protein